MIFGSITVHLDSYEPSITPAMKWSEKSDGKWVCSDRGYQLDLHDSTISIFDTEANVQALVGQLNSNREGITISVDPGEEIFGPHIKTGIELPVTVIKYGRTKKENNKMYSLEITLRLNSAYSYFIDDDVISTPDLIPSTLYSIKDVKQKFESDRPWNVNVMDSFQTESITVIDHESSEVGVLNIDLRYYDRGIQVNNKMGIIIKGFLMKIRSFAMQYPGNIGIPLSGTPLWGGISHPFGFKVDNSPYLVKITSFKLSKPFQSVWDLKLRMVEAN